MEGNIEHGNIEDGGEGYVLSRPNDIRNCKGYTYVYAVLVIP